MNSRSFQQKERIRRRIRSAVDPEKQQYFPETENNGYVKSDAFQRVGIYARVSTDDPAQTSSFELQQTYYEDMVARNPKWELVKIYSDEGKSGTTTQHREGFLEMMQDVNAGKLDLIIVKSISRLARNVVDFLSTIRKLHEKKVGVYFESEGIYSLNDTNHMALSFQATVAEEESRLKSRSMETSLRMRLDHGLPLTPELLGFQKDENGKLCIDPQTANIPKLMFYMYLYGYSTEQIAHYLTLLGKRTYLGNIRWTANGVARTLRNERYCGDVLTRKRFKIFAPDVNEQKTFKNRGEKPQSYYTDEHEAIISHDDFLAVQRIMNNAKFGGTSLLPDLKVIPQGLLKGFVIVHPKWGSFTKEDYINACQSVWIDENTEITAQAGSFDMRNFEVIDHKLFSEQLVPAVSVSTKNISFNTSCIHAMNIAEHIELLIHPIRKMLAIRPTDKDNRYAMQWTRLCSGTSVKRYISCKAFIPVIYEIFGWNTDYRYKMYGCIYRDGESAACVFSDTDTGVYIRKEAFLSQSGIDVTGKLLGCMSCYVRALPENTQGHFGTSYYRELSEHQLTALTSEQWQTQIEGRLCSVNNQLNITPYEELRAFIQQQLGELFEEDKR